VGLAVTRWVLRRPIMEKLQTASSRVTPSL
jgi:hypothetical protein